MPVYIYVWLYVCDVFFCYLAWCLVPLHGFPRCLGRFGSQLPALVCPLCLAPHKSMHLAWKTCVQSRTRQMSTPTWKTWRTQDDKTKTQWDILIILTFWYSLWRGKNKMQWIETTNRTNQAGRFLDGDLMETRVKKWVIESSNQNDPFFQVPCRFFGCVWFWGSCMDHLPAIELTPDTGGLTIWRVIYRTADVSTF